jgi:hypothetical protein
MKNDHNLSPEEIRRALHEILHRTARAARADIERKTIDGLTTGEILEECRRTIDSVAQLLGETTWTLCAMLLTLRGVHDGVAEAQNLVMSEDGGRRFLDGLEVYLERLFLLAGSDHRLVEMARGLRHHPENLIKLAEEVARIAPDDDDDEEDDNE